MINNLIPYKQIQLNCQNKIKNLEITILKVKTNATKNLYLISAYAPGDNRSSFSQDLNLIFEELDLFNPKNYYVLAGDLNARHHYWNDSKINTRGSNLYNWFVENQIDYRITIAGPIAPTFQSSGSYLDIIIKDARIDIINNINNKIPTLEFDSDHNALYSIIKISNSDGFTFTPKQKTSHYNFNRTNWKKFTKELNKHNIMIPNNINLSNEEIDKYINDLSKIISKELHKTTPKYVKHDSIKRYLNPEIKKLQNVKSKLLSEIHRSKKKISSILITYAN